LAALGSYLGLSWLAWKKGTFVHSFVGQFEYILEDIVRVSRCFFKWFLSESV
jgi:hypothetical protein